MQMQQQMFFLLSQMCCYEYIWPFDMLFPSNRPCNFRDIVDVKITDKCFKMYNSLDYIIDSEKKKNNPHEEEEVFTIYFFLFNFGCGDKKRLGAREKKINVQ